MSPRRPRLTRNAVAAALAATVLAAPVADARPVTGESSSPSQGSAPAVEYTEAPRPTVARTIDDGFDLGSAAIGAGGAAALLLLTAASASAVSHRHHRVGVIR